ncbi:MAG: hypothetical protein SCH71_09850 [Desulfobulbaceae bacterium]|nr:hypothetical protein [Desulfobulbaceae bacterium]
MKIVPLFFLLLLFYVSGCAHFYAHRSNLNEQIDIWLAANEFARIEETLGILSSGHPDYKKISSRNNEIAAKKAAFINDTIARAEELLAAEKWQQALNVYHEAQSRLPNDVTIAGRINKLIEERDNRARELRLAAELMDFGEYSLDKGNYTLAEECIDLSYQLASSSAKKTILDSIRKKKKLREDSHRKNELIEAYRKAYDRGDFSMARYHLEALIALDSNNETALELKTQLDSDIKLRVEEGIIQAKTLYSQGQINQALVIWEELFKIDPENGELASFIARAKKVSTKIKTLEKSMPN